MTGQETLTSVSGPSPLVQMFATEGTRVVCSPRTRLGRVTVLSLTRNGLHVKRSKKGKLEQSTMISRTIYWIL